MFPEGQPRMEPPSQEAIVDYMYWENLERFKGLAIVAFGFMALVVYCVSVLSRLFMWPIYGTYADSSWLYIILADFCSPSFWLAMCSTLITVLAFCYFYSMVTPVTANPKAAEPLGRAMWQHVTLKSFGGIGLVALGTVCYFVAASACVSSSLNFFYRGVESWFVLGFLLWNSFCFVCCYYFGNTWAMKFTLPSTERRSILSVKKHLLKLDNLRLVREVFRSLWIYSVLVGGVYLAVSIINNGFDVRFNENMLYSAPRAFLAAYFLTLTLTLLRKGLFNFYNSIYTGADQFPISESDRMDRPLKLHQVLDPFVKKVNVWVWYLGFADLIFSIKHDSGRRAQILEPEMNGVTFDRICHALLLNINKESRKWEFVKEEYMQKYQAPLPKPAPAREVASPVGPFPDPTSPIRPFMAADVPEGLRARVGHGGPTSFPTSPVAASTPVRYFSAPSPDRVTEIGPAGPNAVQKVFESAVKGVKDGHKSFLAVYEPVVRWFKTRGIVASLTEVPEDARAIQWEIDATPLSWAVQSLGLLATASVSEDRKGIVLYHLAKILAALLRLRKALMDATVIANSTARRWRYPGQPCPEAKLRTMLVSAVNDSLGLIAKAYHNDLKTMRLTDDQLAIVEQCRQQLKFPMF